MADEPPESDSPLPPNLRFLRRLVTVLTTVMIVGVITIVVLLVIRLSDNARPILVHPGVFDTPEAVETVGYSVIDGYTVLVGDDGVIRVFTSNTRELVQEIILGE
ncbi:MAG: hypothetical protein JKY00_04055 [Roseicyclus sp.]|nr:hypothetical protein [Roseicyclus sp.]